MDAIFPNQQPDISKCASVRDNRSSSWSGVSAAALSGHARRQSTYRNDRPQRNECASSTAHSIGRQHRDGPTHSTAQQQVVLVHGRCRY